MMKYSLLQLKNDLPDSTRMIRFASLQQLRAMNKTVELNNYMAVYNGTYDDAIESSKYKMCDDLFEKFNLYHPTGFAGHSLSVSDIIVFYEETGIEYFYIDSFGFSKLVFEATNF